MHCCTSLLLATFTFRVKCSLKVRNARACVPSSFGHVLRLHVSADVFIYLFDRHLDIILAKLPGFARVDL